MSERVSVCDANSPTSPCCDTHRSWSERITTGDLRRSNLLDVIMILEDELDINKVVDYFSYEHFYVIYTSFWKLDTDHDLTISKSELAQYGDGGK